MDRIDLAVDVPPVTAADLALPPPAEGTAEAAARVAAARALQAARAEAAGEGAPTLNSRAEGVRRIHVAEALIYRRTGPGAEEGVAAPPAGFHRLSI